VAAVSRPPAVPPEAIADLEVRATFLAGRQVYSKDF
jgi:predicted amidohydrolase YtcJ